MGVQTGQSLPQTTRSKPKLSTRLAQLDEITDRESDQTVFEETALLFDEISASAANAAIVIRLAPLSGRRAKGTA